MKSILVIVCSFLIGSAPFAYHLYKSHSTSATVGAPVNTKKIAPINTDKQLTTNNDNKSNSIDNAGIQKTNKDEDKQNSMQKLIASIQTWITDKNTYRADFNDTTPIVIALEHENLLATVQDFQTLKSDYKTLQTDTQLLIKDTSTIEDVIEKYPALKEDKNVYGAILSIAKAGDDTQTLNNIIQKDLDYLIKLSNQYDDKGNARYKLPIWSPVDELKTYASDFRLQNSMVDQYLTKLK